MGPSAESSLAWIRVCAWCGVVLPGPEPGPESAAVRPVTTHGICPPCRDAFLRAPFDEGPAYIILRDIVGLHFEYFDEQANEWK